MSVMREDDVLYPDLPIVDAHHHLVDRVTDMPEEHNLHRFLVHEYTDYVDGGHNVVGSVVVEGRVMYRAEGPEELRSVGETEFFNGQAAMAASGRYGPCRMAAGIVGEADFRRGDDIRLLLETHLEAAPGRLRGVRHEGLWDADESILRGMHSVGPHLYLDDRFQAGFKHLEALGLSFDAFVLEPQLPDVSGLASAFPTTQIVLDHLGLPFSAGVYAGKADERFPIWKANMAEIARHPNVAVKIGGLGSFISGSKWFRADPPATAAQLADEWRPYAETAVELFGAARSMFVSNAPTDGSGSFDNVCNAYKMIFAGCSDDELRDIFARSAARFYRLDLPV